MKDINRKLLEAVENSDIKTIRQLLSAGANPNFKGYNGDTLLHLARRINIVQELLLRGRCVNAKNRFDETPLHTIISRGWPSVELVRELLNHGACVNATDRNGNTPLDIVLRKWRIDVEVVRELLDHGATIKIRNLKYCPLDIRKRPLINGMCHDKCAQRVIRITLMNNLLRRDTMFARLHLYSGGRRYRSRKLSTYLIDCIGELRKMKTRCPNDQVSIYRLIVSKKTTISKLILDMNDDQIFQLPINYPIYYDLIYSILLRKIANRDLERASLLNKLSELEIYAKSEKTNQTILLDCYSKDEFAKYLSNIDLLNLLLAFYGCDDKPSCSKENTESVTPSKQNLIKLLQAVINIEPTTAQTPHWIRWSDRTELKYIFH